MGEVYRHIIDNKGLEAYDTDTKAQPYSPRWSSRRR